MVSDVDRENWRKAFKQIGSKTLRQQFAKYQAGMPHERQLEAEKWLLEEDEAADRREEGRYQTMRWLTLIAAVASVVAAVTGLIAVWPKP
jgi:Flp pilus assembly protein TadB